MKKYKIYFSVLLFLLGSRLLWAQSYYFPYYGKNKVIYQKFNWSRYQTDHFTIYYYIQNEKLLEKVANLAESAYLKISQKARHQLAKPVPLIYYQTHTDFEQTNLYPGILPAGVMAFAEPVLHRIVLPGDIPIDNLQHLIEHELAHVFEYSILYGDLTGPIYDLNQPPLWVMEGFAEYCTDTWDPVSLMILRDTVLNDRIPEIGKSGRLVSKYPLPRHPAYDFGHAIFDFLEKEFGLTGIRQLWNTVKKTSFIEKKNPLKRAFKLDHKQFNYKFKKFLREKFKGYLTKENPEDYSISFGPEFPYAYSLSHQLSPSGDIVAVLTFNLRDYDLDILLISTKDGSVIKNITKGYTLEYEQIKIEFDPSSGRNICWSSDGEKIAFFGRKGEKHTLFLLEAITGKTLKSIKIPIDLPSSPCFSNNNQKIIFTGLKDSQPDIFEINLINEKIVQLTNNELYEKAPSISPDGKFITYTIRVDTYDKIFLSPTENLDDRKQLTFGKGNDIAPCFSPDGKEIFFSSDKTGTFNIYSINLETWELKKYTDVRTGNFFPVPFPNNPKKIIFSSFHKGMYQLFQTEFKNPEVEEIITPKKVITQEEIPQFTPLITQKINKNKIEQYKGMGKLYLVSRPPVETLISTDGSIYGGSAISFTDILGDYTVFLMAYQVRQFRSLHFGYINQKRRLQYMLHGFQYTIFYYPSYYYWYPEGAFNYSYYDAIATRTITGAEAVGYYPFNRYYRAEASLGYYRYSEDFLYWRTSFPRFFNGNMLAASFSLVGETTRFKYYGPYSGSTFRLSVYQTAPVSKSFLQSTTFEADLRKYFKLISDTVLAVRFNGFLSRGKDPFLYYYGGNNEVRSVYYREIIANEGFFFNAELRFPLIDSIKTIIGQLGPIRGVFFLDFAHSKVKDWPAGFYVWSPEGYRLVDVIGSYGWGVELFLFGIPLHLEWVRRIEIPEISISKKTEFKTRKFNGIRIWFGFDF
ncbi:MAG: hypothetical protein ACE5WD_05755 [Candidatus Aminicenantia bacterium]